MKVKFNLIFAILVIIITIGMTTYAHEPTGGNQAPNGMDGDSYAMMGGHGMMGGSGSDHGMTGGYGHNGNRYNRDTRHQNRYNSRDYRQDDPNVKADTESLMDEIDARRKELSSLLRANNADKDLIDQKVEELNRLERYLDERLR